MEWERKGSFFWRRRGQTGPLKADPFLPLWLPQGNPSPTHTPATTVYIAQRLERENEGEKMSRENICMYFFHTAVLHTWAKKGEGWTYFYTIKWKCNSREKIERFEQTLFMRFPIPTCSVALQVLNLDRKTASRGSAHRFFLSAHVNGTVNVSITWIGPPTVICFFPLHTSVSQSHVYDVMFHTDSTVPVRWHHITVSASQCISLRENKAINER